MGTPANCALPGESRVLSFQFHICPEEELQDHPGLCLFVFPVNGMWSALDSGPFSLVGDITALVHERMYLERKLS